MMVLQAFVLVWEFIGGSHAHWIVIVVEALISLMLVVEVTINIITIPDYFRRCFNVVDFVITVLCILFFAGKSASLNGCYAVWHVCFAVSVFFAHSLTRSQIQTTSVFNRRFRNAGR
jgi:hypothetical protein